MLSDDANASTWSTSSSLSTTFSMSYSARHAAASSLKRPSAASVVSKPFWSQKRFSSSASARIFSSA